MYYTLQGEGAQTGRAAVFLRFAGCNLWSGREQDRAQAICQFCDTDFVGTDGQNGGKFTSASDLALRVTDLWGEQDSRHRYVVCTGGEPVLQLDTALIDALHKQNFKIAVETNGTQLVPDTIDWICVSPKATAPLVQTTGNEMKLVYPQVEKSAQPEIFAHLDFQHFFLQPMDVADEQEHQRNIERTTQYCLDHPQWRLSLQTHKYIGID